MDPNKMREQFSSFGSKLMPFAEKLNKNFSQTMQWGQEQLGKAEDVTEMPQEYLDLEKRVDAIRSLHQTLGRIGRSWEEPNYDMSRDASETFTSMARNIQVFAQGVEGGATDYQEPDRPRNIEQALSTACHTGAEKVSVEEPLGAALFKYANVMDKIGDADVAFCSEATQKVIKPINTTLTTTIDRAVRARKQVQSARLSLDASRARFKAAREDKKGAIRPEVEQAEDQFVALVEEAMTLMKAVMEDPEPLRNLADLVAAQLAFHEQAHNLLRDLAPEIDEIQVTQEALYRNSRPQ
ncbi:MAG: hypothetical protein DHS80DRAFT_12928 [Piptocephalis tieghemiana]|nr:MAG: hypothetical protein DHS80DRAFT_12928 [Piptocephalis tieghemiana]